MSKRRQRGLGFFPGLFVGTAVGLGASAIYGADLSYGAQKLQQEEFRWRTRVIEFSSQALSQAENVVLDTESDLRARLKSLTDGIPGDGNLSDKTSQEQERED